MKISLSNLYVSLKGREVLADLSAFFESGKIHCIIGKNGSGKTTLLKAIMNLIPYEGGISLVSNEGVAINTQKLDAKALAKRIAFLPQNPITPEFVPVEKFVLFGRFPYIDFWGSYSREDTETVADTLEKMGLSMLRNREVQNLSGGEFQRVCLARAIVQQASVLLLDEPSAALDPRQKTALLENLTSLANEGKTILCVTHDEFLFSESHIQVWGMKNGNWVYQEKGGLPLSDIMEIVY